MIMEEFEDIFGDNIEIAPDPIDSVEPLVEPEDFLAEDIIDPIKEDNIINDLLKAKGIENSQITIIGDNDEEQIVNFYDLTREEQLEILNTSEPPQDDILDEVEIEFINLLRINNITVQEYLEQYKASILAEISAAEPVYEVDSYDDEDLFLLDLKIKFELTDEELQLELEKELKNPELFTKKTAKLRSEYKQLEDQDKENKRLEFENSQKEEYDNFVNTMTAVSNAVTDYHGVFLDDEEKVETLNYLAGLDDSNETRFSKDLKDPKKLYEAAWYLRYGKEAFQALEAAYEEEIKKLKKELKDTPRAVVPKPSKNVKNIHDLN